MDLQGLSLRELKQQLLAIGGEERQRLLCALERDPRKGAGDLARKVRLEEEKACRQEARWRAFCDPERQLWEKGYRRIAGVDEAGRGPLAGPVVAAAVILPPDFTHYSLDDSKRMTAPARQTAYETITSAAEAWGVGVASVKEIDRHNILGAVHLAMDRALSALEQPAEFALVDGRPLTSCSVPHQALVGGDRRCRVIAAASVVAKVSRDRMMEELDRDYPGYGLASHKGYATARHFEALQQLGPTSVHRRSFLKGDRQLEMATEDSGESPQAWGARAEELVASDYESRGYTVAGRRWRGGGGELDLVCIRGDEIVMVEIKAARSTLAGSPLAWLGSAQRRRWRGAAAAYLREMGGDSARRRLRFDLVGVMDRRDGPPELTRVEGVEP